MADIFVTKANGEQEPFSEEKLLRGIQHATVPKNIQQDILAVVQKKLYDGISTAAISEYINQYLAEKAPEARSRFNLKKAIMELGPTGYPFESFVGSLLREYGYEVKQSVVLRGTCVTHEVDVLAHQAGEHYFVECKYHNQSGTRSDVKTVLYVKARADDLRSYIEQHDGADKALHRPWVFTNTKFSHEAISYAHCVAMKLTGWGYPLKENLQQMIEEKNLYPITCLATLSQGAKKKLLLNNIVLVKEIVEDKTALRFAGLSIHEREAVIKESEFL